MPPFDGLYDPEGLLDKKENSAFVNKLLSGGINSSDIDHKTKDPRFPLYSIKMNDARRLMCTTLQVTVGHKTIQVLWVLEQVDNHDYQKSKAMKHKVLKAMIEKGRDAAIRDLEAILQGKNESTAAKSTAARSIDRPRAKYKSANYFRKAHINLTQEQQNALNMPMPLVIDGCAGAGKTGLVLPLIEQLADDPRYRSEGVTRILYVTRSPLLVERMQQDVVGLQQVLLQKYGPDIVVEIKSLQALEQDILPESSGFKLISTQDILTWLDNKWVKPNKKMKAKNPLFNAIGIFNDLAIIKSIGVENYENLTGTWQCVFKTPEEKKLIIAISVVCDKYLAEQFACHPKLIPYHGELRKAYAAIIYDESQNASLGEIGRMLSRVDDNRLVLLQDSNQCTEILLPIKDLIASFYKFSFNEARLFGSIRCKPRISEFGNAILEMKHDAIGGALEKKAISTMQSALHHEDTGRVFWSEDEAHLSTLLQELNAQNILYAVVVPDKKSKERFPDAAVILELAEIDGLEYDVFIVVDPLIAEVFEEANKLIKLNDSCAAAAGAALSSSSSSSTPYTTTTEVHRAKTLAHLDVARHFNQLYVAATRAQTTLMVVQSVPNKAFRHQRQHVIDKLAALATPGYPEAATLHQETPPDWREEARMHFMLNHMENVKRIHARHFSHESYASFIEPWRPEVPMSASASSSSGASSSSVFVTADSKTAVNTPEPTTYRTLNPSSQRRRGRGRKGGPQRDQQPSATSTPARENLLPPSSSAASSTPVVIRFTADSRFIHDISLHVDAPEEISEARIRAVFDNYDVSHIERWLFKMYNNNYSYLYWLFRIEEGAVFQRLSSPTSRYRQILQKIFADNKKCLEENISYNKHISAIHLLLTQQGATFLHELMNNYPQLRSIFSDAVMSRSSTDTILFPIDRTPLQTLFSSQQHFMYINRSWLTPQLLAAGLLRTRRLDSTRQDKVFAMLFGLFGVIMMLLSPYYANTAMNVITFWNRNLLDAEHDRHFLPGHIYPQSYYQAFNQYMQSKFIDPEYYGNVVYWGAVVIGIALVIGMRVLPLLFPGPLITEWYDAAQQTYHVVPASTLASIVTPRNSITQVSMFRPAPPADENQRTLPAPGRDPLPPF